MIPGKKWSPTKSNLVFRPTWLTVYLSKSKIIKMALKEIMRSKGYRYEDAARALKVSLPTMRRWMSQSDLTLSQLSDFAQWLDLDLFELLDTIRRDAGKGVEFSDAQENFFAANPKAILIFRMIAKGIAAEDIEKKLHLTKPQLQKHLVALERHDLIRLFGENRLRVKTTGPFKWKKGGPLENTYLEKIVRATANHVFRKARASNRDQIDAFEILFRPFEFRLQPKTQKQLFKELNELIDKYSSIAKIELTAKGEEEAREVTGILLGDSFSVWNEILGEEGP